MADEKKKNLPAKQERTSFLDKVRSSSAISATSKQETLVKALTQKSRPRLLFSMDATASREAAWNVTKEITDAMFKAVPGTLDVALAYHGGGRLQEVTPFSPDAKVFLDKVHTVQCKAGVTALNEILGKAIDISKLKALIYIGDCFEENPALAVELAQQLKLKGVRCFMFHDTSSGNQGYDVATAHEVFGQIAQITGGALLPFDENSPEMVKQLLEAIAVYASFGIKALEQEAKFLPAARLLLKQMQGEEKTQKSTEN